MIRRLSLHKVKVQALAFSPNDKYLASLGGQDDNSIICWDLEKGAAICGSPASKDSSGETLSLAYLNNDDNTFVTGGHSILRVWELNEAQRKVKVTDCQTGQIKRIVKCITIDPQDEFMYCGTTTGDLLQVNLKTKLFKHSGPPKEKVCNNICRVGGFLPKTKVMQIIKNIGPLQYGNSFSGSPPKRQERRCWLRRWHNRLLDATQAKHCQVSSNHTYP